MNTADTVKYFFQKEKLISIQELDQLGPEIQLIDNGIIDSLNVLKLISYLEEEFKIVIKDEELTPENFANLRAICELLEGKGC